MERARKLRLLLVGLTPDARPDDHMQCRSEVLSLVDRINLVFPAAVCFRESAGRVMPPQMFTECPLYACTEWSAPASPQVA